MSWYARFIEDPDRLDEIIVEAERELDEARRELNVRGRRIDTVASQLPHLQAHRWHQWQELEAILKVLNMKLDSAKGAAHRHFMERYDRQLTSRDAEKYAASDQQVLEMALLCNRVGLLRAKFESIVGAIKTMSYSLRLVADLRREHMEDATL